jgi:hypothetical protein
MIKRLDKVVTTERRIECQYDCGKDSHFLDKGIE